MRNIEVAITELHKGFALLNKQFYEAKLPEPALLIQGQGKRANALGWFTCGKVWTEKDSKIKKYEIIITAEYLDRGVIEVMETLHHEMVHLFNFINKIKDTSRNYTYHNKFFKAAAEKRGMVCEHDPTIGWSITSFTDETKKIVNAFGLNPDAFIMSRVIEGTGGKGPKKSSMIKWECPCGVIVRSTKVVNIICGDCKKAFEKVEG